MLNIAITKIKKKGSELWVCIFLMINMVQLFLSKYKMAISTAKIDFQNKNSKLHCLSTAISRWKRQFLSDHTDHERLTPRVDQKQ